MAEVRAIDTAERRYVLGHSDSELRRLAHQGEFFRELTEDVLRRAGLVAGMRVLDVGCGVGDVSLLAAEVVGPTGSVLGIDRAPEAIATARRRAEAAGLRRLRYAVAELDEFSTDEPFDALIGRHVLMYLPDVAATLRRLSRALRPGGIVAFQEMAMLTCRSVPDVPLYRQCLEWVVTTFQRAGASLDMGGELFATFLRAGLPMPQMIAAGRVEGGPDSRVYEIMAETLRSLLPIVERLGVATAAEIDIETLADRLRREAVERSLCIIAPILIGAWTRVPA